MPKAAKPDAFLNERLMSDLRPTLFLAQLSNLLAGNISIVHGVTGSSRTFMGEEASGVDAVRIALSRIAAGQSDIALVGGAHNGERPDLLLLYEFGGYNLKGEFAPVWERGPKGGFALGSLGAFLVIEERRHAEARGAKPLARLAATISDRSNRKAGQVTAALARMWDKIAGRREERPRRRHFGRDRRGAGHGGGARLPRPAPGGCRARHRYLSRSWARAAVSHERCARRDRGQSW